MRKGIRACWLSAVLIGLAVLLLNTFACRNGGQPTQTGVQAQASSTLELGLGQFTRVADTKYLSAPALVVDDNRTFYESLKSGRGSKEGQTRNYFFLNPDDLAQQWLLPHSNYLFLTRQDWPEMPREEKEKPVASKPAAVVVRVLYYELVKANTNDNKVLDAYDRKTIALSDVNGGNYAELINDIDDVVYKENRSPNEWLMIYRKGDKHFATKINLSQRQITDTKELLSIPKIQPPLG